MDIPIAPDPNHPMLYSECVAGQELLDTAEKGCLTDRVLECQILGERVGIGLDLRQKGKKRLCFRGENEYISDDGVVEGLDTETVAGAEQTPASVVPDRKREHAA